MLTEEMPYEDPLMPPEEMRLVMAVLFVAAQIVHEGLNLENGDILATKAIRAANELIRQIEDIS